MRLQESVAFNKAASLDTHKALVHIFFAQRATKKVRWLTRFLPVFNLSPSYLYIRMQLSVHVPAVLVGMYSTSGMQGVKLHR